MFDVMNRPSLFCFQTRLETTLQDLKKDPRHRREYREAKKLLKEVSMFPVLTSQSQSPIT